jgi:hypothetical protein
MKKRIIEAFKRREIEVVVTIIGVVFIGAMAAVALTLRSSMATPPYESLTSSDLDRVFATGYLRFREDDGTPYLKLELHNGTLWWIKKVEFEFDGSTYTVRDGDAFRPLHMAALRCPLRKAPHENGRIEFDLKIVRAFGHPPAQVQWEREKKKVAGAPKTPDMP